MIVKNFEIKKYIDKKIFLIYGVNEGLKMKLLKVHKQLQRKCT